MTPIANNIFPLHTKMQNCLAWVCTDFRILQISFSKSTFICTKEEEFFYIWHHRLGHFHGETMMRMIEAKRSEGSPRRLRGKHARLKFPTPWMHQLEFVQLFHIHECRQLREASLGVICCLVTFVDNLLHDGLMFFNKSKCEVLHPCTL